MNRTALQRILSEEGLEKTSAADFDGWGRGQTQKVYGIQIQALMNKWFGALARHGAPGGGEWMPYSPEALRPVKGNSSNPDAARYSPGVLHWTSDTTDPVNELAGWLKSKGWKVESQGARPIMYRDTDRLFDWSYRVMIAPSPFRGEAKPGVASAAVAGLWPGWK